MLRVLTIEVAGAPPLEQLSGLEGQLALLAFGPKHAAALTHAGQVYTHGDGALEPSGQ